MIWCPAAPIPLQARLYCGSMRIGFDARYITDRYHGIGRFAYSLLEAMLSVPGDDRFVLIVHPGYPDTRFDLARLAADPRVEVVSVRLPLLLPWEQAAWPILVRRHRLDMVHSPYVVGPVAVGVPVIVTVQDLIFERYPRYTPGRMLRIAYRTMASASLRRATAIVAASEATRTDLERFYPRARGRIHVIPHGVAASFAPVHDPRRLREVRERYGLPPRFILAVGAGRPHKNLEVVVKAARLSPDDGPAVILVSAPDPRFPDVVAELIAQSERTGKPGRVRRIQDVREEDLAALYSLAEVFVLPSFVEGFGLPMLESMAAGTPVIAADASVMPEIGGDAVVLFDPHDPSGLATELARLAGDPNLRAQLTTLGLARASDFTWERSARSTLELYRTLRSADAGRRA
jgi:glycosyltransferase involved in cell wall biosynthesis